MKLRITRQAECDLSRMQDFYEKNGWSSENIVAEIEAAFQHLLQWPLTGHHRLDLLDAKYRFWRAGSYFIIYRIEASSLFVMSVTHASRDLARDLVHLQ